MTHQVWNQDDWFGGWEGCSCERLSVLSLKLTSPGPAALRGQPLPPHWEGTLLVAGQEVSGDPHPQGTLQEKAWVSSDRKVSASVLSS